MLLFSCQAIQANEKSLQINPDIKIGTLENGMSYYVMKNSEPKNRIFFRLVVKAGSNLEEDDQKGVAHLVEHLAFNGTENFKKQEIIAFLESVGMKFGAGLNAYTSFEETVYMLEIPADNKEILQKALLILHDWACAVSFEDEEVEKEKLEKEKAQLIQNIERREKLLSNENYVAKAPSHLVEQERAT